LLKLPPVIQTGLKEKKISMGHARAILSLEDPVAQIDVYQQTIKNTLSVRQVEELVRGYARIGKKATTKSSVSVPHHIRQIQDELSSSLSTRVLVKQDKSGKGQITISFFSDDDLFRIKEMID
jgi:ParB family chromosome partitioning protein